MEEWVPLDRYKFNKLDRYWEMKNAMEKVNIVCSTRGLRIEGICVFTLYTSACWAPSECCSRDKKGH